MTRDSDPNGTRASSSGSVASGQADRFVHEHLPPRGQWPQFVYGLPELQIADRANLVDVLFRKAFDNGLADRPFLRSERITLTYADALERVRRIAQVLTEDFPLVPGHRVLLRGGNSIGMALAWLGVVYAGMVAVATMPLLRAKELGDIIEKARPALALCDASLLEELETAWSGHAAQGDIVMFNAMSTPGSLAVRSAAKDGNARPCDVLADDAALLAFTSGTTGQPKAAVHTHRDVLAACETWPRHVLQARPDDIVIGSPPLAFTFGLGGLLVFPMWAGASVYFPTIACTPEAMVQRIHRVGATILYTAPTFYRQMASFAKLRGTPSLRLCVSAGENLPDATRQLWKDATGIAIVDGIGATEMFHIFISSAGANVRRGAIGKVVPGYTAKVVDDNGSEVPPGVVGKLAVIGPTGCRYLDDPRQAHYVKDGWNYPGDAFTQDAEGYFFFQARADDMIITSGYNVAGPEVEGALLAHPAVAECAVIGVSDAMRGMVVKAFVVLKPTETAGDAMVQLLQDHVKSTLAPFKYPRQIEFRHELPRTPTGKLQRFKLRTP
ncbi:AMP-binding protein [Polaromonas sp.]|jgi:2-aminobenzoate-CoA ligase|uniref:AMP-binding protein n=1 Tax=Polaromonas sp. TaxID=1869339 RepID=UPI002D12258C|nr:AMP-binding protein [Polaromonas sp.]HQS31973.1 AMP-binding protein [Polaromonas sp.]HQS91204.1 AMP-binding protein [Polaromonas sp.]